MNIFATSDDPKEAALALDDVRLRKMLIESAQMLSTALFVTGSNGDFYKPCYIRHPCTMWVSNSRGNFDWLLEHAMTMLTFYEKTWKKTHGSRHVLQEISKYRNTIWPGDLEPFVNCTEFKGLKYLDTPVTSLYRMQMRKKWDNDTMELRSPRWTDRQQPQWR